VKRRLFKLLAGVSLLICATVVWAWITHLHALDSVSYRTPRRDFIAAIRPLGLFVGTGPLRTEPVTGWETKHIRIDRNDGDRFNYGQYCVRAIGFAHGEFGCNVLSGSRTSVDHIQIALADGRKSWCEMHYLLLPYWFLILAALVLPLLLLFRQASRFRKTGQCCTCGFDLRATPARCPECGAVPKII
jgi:hypothetical protein